MAMIIRPAIEVTQGRYKLYMTSFTLAEFSIPKFYSVKKLDTSKRSMGDLEYQRVLNEKKTEEFVEDIREAAQTNKSKRNILGECFYPTSAFLATEKSLCFDEKNQKISFKVKDVCPFNVVDGQHRVEALKRAYEQDSSLASFSIPVVLAAGVNLAAQMLQFLIINSKQQSVGKDVTRFIGYKFYEMLNPPQKTKKKSELYMPSWVEKIANKKSHDALAIACFLKETEESPWFDRIRMANESSEGKKNGKGVEQEAFVDSVITDVFARGNPLSEKDLEYQKQFLFSYWRAIFDIISPWDWRFTYLRTPKGVVFFHRVSRIFAAKCLSDKADVSVDILKGYFGDVKKFLQENNKNLGLYAYDEYGIGRDVLASEIMERPLWQWRGVFGGDVSKSSVRSLSYTYADFVKEALYPNHSKFDFDWVRKQVRFNDFEIDGVPQKAGCYALMDDADNIFYIGQAENLRNRMGDHLRDPQKTRKRRGWGHATLFRWTILPKEEISSVEKRLLDDYKAKNSGKLPPFNKVNAPTK